MACEIKYKSFLFYKNEFESQMKFQGRMARELSFFIREYLQDFQQFEKVILYYDNGQHELAALLKEAFAIYASRTQFVKDVSPERYKLFQVADLACTLELTHLKLKETGALSASEQQFFGGAKNFRKIGRAHV